MEIFGALLFGISSYYMIPESSFFKQCGRYIPFILLLFLGIESAGIFSSIHRVPLTETLLFFCSISFFSVVFPLLFTFFTKHHHA